MYDTITSIVMVLICLPIFAFWSVVTWRLLAEQRTTEGGSPSKPSHPPMLTTIFA